ncbi:hypothetical protein HAX54_045949 [Datura stramonium]|uniref:Uncharacterized protein n=1 Tax=Datura stramonium TaxID=4076 RepID=A0ABS8SR95_DATST|nr:hypothetical protein [Datura stramonium]
MEIRDLAENLIFISGSGISEVQRGYIISWRIGGYWAELDLNQPSVDIVPTDYSPSPLTARASAGRINFRLIGQSGWFFAPSFGVAAIFRFILFFKGFIVDLNPSIYDGSCRCIGALLYAFMALFCKKILYLKTEIRAAEDPEFETFYTKNILLNEGIRAWMAAQDQPHENLIFPEEDSFFFVGHLWHARGRARAAAAGFEKGIDRDTRPVLFMTPLN